MNVRPNIAGWGHKEFLSGDKWLEISIDADKVESLLPSEGAMLSYSFNLSSSGPAEIWDRIGFEFVRSPFDWRVDNEDWKRVSPSDLTTDMQEFETWTEVAWLELGQETLTAGTHTLQIRLPKTLAKDGKPERILYASDALLITPGRFHPNGKYKPDEPYQTDVDREAAAKVFSVPAGSSTDRQKIDLGGLWEICRDDENLPKTVEQPIDRLPEDPKWYGINVPSDKNQARPELTMAHRVWYRTRLDVPAEQIGRSFRLTFPLNNLNTTLYLNGKLCGFNKNPLVEWSCDVTPAIKVGRNEICVGIRDAWYGYSSNPKDPMKLRKAFVLPLAVTGGGFQDLAYPVWGCFKSGILDTPRLTIADAVAATDVFVKPSVAKKALDADVTLLNATGAGVNGQVSIEAVSGQVVKQLGHAPFHLDAGQKAAVQVGGAWADPVLWWPDRPHMYDLRVRVSVGGKAVDVSDTPFGFREWSHRGKDFLLNGIVWHGWAELTQGDSLEQWLKNYRQSGQRFMRLSGPTQNGGVYWKGLSFEQALDWFDRNGVVVRRCGPLDGEMIGYWAIENDPDLQALYHTRVKKQLLDNWRDQMVAQVKSERNHPSIGIWSIENEWLYINCINLYGDLMDDFEREEKATFDAVMAADPTRLAMADGGGAGKANLFPVQGDHYVFTNDPGRYPDIAYEPFPDGAGRGRWSWDQQRPRFIGEEFFANGINPSDYAWIQGEDAFGGKVASQKGMALIQSMLTEGYRWGGYYGAWHFWIGDEGAKYGKYTANAERAVFCRQHDWSFGSGAVVRRTFGILNDSHSSDPLRFTYSLSVAGKTLLTRSKTVSVLPGTSLKFDETLPIPRVDSRKTGVLRLSLSVGRKNVFQDEKPLSVLPLPSRVAGSGVGLYDPRGGFSLGSGLRRVASLGSVPADVRVLVIAPDALTDSDSTKSVLAAVAASGRRVVVLDQSHPLHFQALPLAMSATSDSGDFAFPEDLDQPVFSGLAGSDFQGWSGGVYRNAYAKPERGAKSLVQVGPRLGETALVEAPVGSGVLLLCQVRMGSGNVVSERLLGNLIRYANSYKLAFRPVVAATGGDPELVKALGKIGLKFRTGASALDAISPPSSGIAIVAATPENLHSLAVNEAKVRAFTAAGGTIVFHGLTPEGLSDYNRTVGVSHVIRPFRREKTELRTPRDPLAAGLSQSDVVMYSAERMFSFNNDMFAASDIFNYVVDFDDVAPFAKLPGEGLYNTVNGFVSDDGWKYIYSFDLDHQKPEYTMEFPRAETFTELDWTGNAFYHKVKRLSLTFDGRETVSFDVAPNNVQQVLPISPPRRGQRVELKILEWTQGEAGANVTGIDNISLKALRGASFYERVHPLLNVGGLVRYTQGKGGFVLENLLLKPNEEVPENAGKKLTILRTILNNLHAPFTSGKTVVAGAAGLQYQFIDLSHRANQYRSDRGWFGDRATTFADLPAGKHVFAGVPFVVFDFPTSPVPNAVMLGGPGIPGNLPDAVTGIPVDGKVSALFFLEAARIDSRRSDQDVREGKKFEMARYVVHYADGQTVAVPVFSELDVDDYSQENPRALPGSQIAWTYAYPNSKLKAVAYSQQWNNPRPDVAISSVDLTYGAAPRGVPALLAITAVK